ncbi:MAG: mechanosensitive ion channel [Bacteroidales bacterium]|nr:mechanosensitive ion channel [Bacteroidales bacterium]
MIFHILQAVTPDAEQIAQKFSADSLTTKGAEIMEILRNTPPKELVEEMITSVIKFGIKVLFALVIYLVGAWLIRKFKHLIAKAFTKRGADATLTSFIQSLVTAALWILLIMVMIGTLGINTTSLAALLAAGGMAIGMAMSGTVQNFAGGIMLLAFKPFKAGDFIEAQGYTGTVKEINIVSTKITTVDNKLVILPNGALSNGTINNYSANPVRRIDRTVDVSYGCNAAAVKEKLMQIIGSQEKILDATTPGAQNPTVVLSSMKDSSVEFLIRVWVKSADYFEVSFWLNEAVYSGLPEQEIQFPFPQVDVHIKQD